MEQNWGALTKASAVIVQEAAIMNFACKLLVALALLLGCRPATAQVMLVVVGLGGCSAALVWLAVAAAAARAVRCW